MDNPESASSPRPSALGGFIALAALALLAGGAYWYFALPDFDKVTREEKEMAIKVAALTREGNYDQAVSQYESIVGNPAYDKNTKARATVAATHARLRGVDNLDEAIQHVRDLKAIVADTSIEPKIRATAIYFLGAAYDIDGFNDALYREVYSTEPYASMHVGVSRSSSALQVYEWSYSIYPLARTALGIALSNVKGVFRDRYADVKDPEQPAPEQLLERAEQYLKNAEFLMSQESRDRRFTAGISDMYYRYWHTFLVGALAHFKGGEYAEQYRSEYEALIRDFEDGEDNNQEMAQYLNFAYWNYATMLVLIDKDDVAAKAQLEKLIRHVQADRFYTVNQFVSVIKSYKRIPRTDLNSLSLKFLGDISPEFKKFVEDVQNNRRHPE